MKNAELARSVAERTGLTQAQAEQAVTAVFQEIAEEVARGAQVSLAGFGTFEARTRAARTGRNPRTGEPLEIAASRAPGFRPYGAFRSMM